MKRLVLFQWFFLIAHIVAMVFGLAGLILVLPHPEFIATLPSFGQTLFQLSMTGGGVVYIVLGALTVFLHGYFSLGLRSTALFFIPAVLLSLGSELLGTSTGFPFGHYAYLNGLGYKVAGLVPFTIPLSWFYLGFSAYLLAYSGLRVAFSRWRMGELSLRLLAVVTGAVLLTAWDLVLDPAMSQAPFPFWEFQEVGEFFGMPYRNLVGWVGTGTIFMGVAALLGRKEPLGLNRGQLVVPLCVYLANFAFGAMITLTQLDERFMIPTALGISIGVLPAIVCWWVTPARGAVSEAMPDRSEPAIAPVPVLSAPSKRG
ncbi:gamma-carotene 1'-hydroxylase CruF [Altericista sp. CCNU0014]|uniref:gamma-carotene 1'-hydroxylase CruF n=1 Tax=Altericista sp. CCNU0014 TaxID=3082949 RepID=UPI00384EA73E